MRSSNRPDRRRRDVLIALGTGALAETAGCLDAGSDGGADAADDGNETNHSTQEEGPYARVYEETVDSVVLVQTDAGGGTGFVHDGSPITNQHITRGQSTVSVQFSQRLAGGEPDRRGRLRRPDASISTRSPPTAPRRTSFRARPERRTTRRPAGTCS